ncbi:MAG TPA: hypothetical protein VHI95_17020 [Acidimicrobiales bacterium]|jgi:hypothetical protein|nr:hypothetical protein [Acidimicrobiales bacterium]
MTERSRYRLTIIHSVPDYDRWATVIREGRRERPGVVSTSVFRSVDDPNEVMVDIELDSVEAAQQLLPSNFRDLLDRAGIEIYPPVFIGELVDELSTGVERQSL